MAKKKLEDHPIAAVFPLLPKEELEQLAKDIEESGLLNPILLYETKILDGRNRYRAILTIPKMAEDLDPDENSKGYFDQYEGNDPVGHVISLNCHRRHLTESQRAAIAAELAKLKHGQRADSSIELSEPITQEQAAKLLNVSKSSVKRAKVVKEADPELHAKVKAGEVSLNAAVKAVKPEPEPKPEPIAEPEPQTPKKVSDGPPTAADFCSEDYDEPRSWFAKHRVITNRYLEAVMYKLEPEVLKNLAQIFYRCMRDTEDYLKDKFGMTYEEICGVSTDNN